MRILRPKCRQKLCTLGYPVVSFNIANISEIVTDENDGFIVDNFDDEIMANKSYELLYETNKINSKENKLKGIIKLKDIMNPEIL